MFDRSSPSGLFCPHLPCQQQQPQSQTSRAGGWRTHEWMQTVRVVSVKSVCSCPGSAPDRWRKRLLCPHSSPAQCPLKQRHLTLAASHTQSGAACSEANILTCQHVLKLTVGAMKPVRKYKSGTLESRKKENLISYFQVTQHLHQKSCSAECHASASSHISHCFLPGLLLPLGLGALLCIR